MFTENFQELYFQHDGAPPYYATAVRDYLNKRFQRKVIGRRADIDMPPHSPNSFKLKELSVFCNIMGTTRKESEGNLK
ncbi:hypothetical protein J6590_069830 [Homalodisca vitripennis]|nr:hypothetical protein J6590_069830 [Homalodisca vitripennis]